MRQVIKLPRMTESSRATMYLFAVKREQRKGRRELSGLAVALSDYSMITFILLSGEQKTGRDAAN
jgi:hypothetical protein